MCGVGVEGGGRELIISMALSQRGLNFLKYKEVHLKKNYGFDFWGHRVNAVNINEKLTRMLR